MPKWKKECHMPHLNWNYCFSGFKLRQHFTHYHRHLENTDLTWWKYFGQETIPGTRKTCKKNSRFWRKQKNRSRNIIWYTSIIGRGRTKQNMQNLMRTLDIAHMSMMWCGYSWGAKNLLVKFSKHNTVTGTVCHTATSKGHYTTWSCFKPTLLE